MRTRFTARVPLLAIALLLLSACGKLSKDDARAMMQAKFYDKEDNIYCVWAGGVVHDEGGSGATKRFSFMSPSDAEKSCIKELTSAAILRQSDCVKTYYGVPTCDVEGYTLGRGVDFTRTNAIQFVCGKKKLGDVVSIITEGKKATVKYSRTITRDDALSAKLTDCTLDGQKAGSEEQTREFRKDDDGAWAPVD